MKKAGAAGASANRITLLRGLDASGAAPTRSVFIQGLNSPFGMALVGDKLYVADTDAILRFPYQPGAISIHTPGVKVMDLPAGSINHHWTKNVVASPDGKYLYALGAHTASLGLAFYDAGLFPPSYRGGVFIGQHGSWNRKPHSGYKVVFVPFAGGKPSGPPQDFLFGYLDNSGKAHGRPVGVAVDKQGALLVADDVGNIIWRVAPSATTTAGK